MPPQQEIHCYYLKKMENEQTWLGVLHKEKRTEATLKKNEKKKRENEQKALQTSTMATFVSYKPLTLWQP